MMEDIEICNCKSIMKSEIGKVIKEKDLKTVGEVQDKTNAGTGCGCCISDLEAVLNEINNKN